MVPRKIELSKGKMFVVQLTKIKVEIGFFRERSEIQSNGLRFSNHHIMIN